MMQFMRGNRSRRIDTLISIFLILGVLLIILASLALLGSVLSVLHRFKSVILLFVLGAILAYLMSSLVRVMQRAVRKRWAAILSAYLLLFVMLAAFGVLLLNPFITQARSLVNNLQHPTAASLHHLVLVENSSRTLEQSISRQRQAIAGGATVSQTAARKTLVEMRALQNSISALAKKTPRSREIVIPPSYIRPIQNALSNLESAYAPIAADPRAASNTELRTALAEAHAVLSAEAKIHHKISSSPLLLLSMQIWLDQHGIKADLNTKFGKALQQLNSQLASIVNNALDVALQAGNLLLNTVLTLIISIYFVADGSRLMAWLVSLAPPESRGQAKFFVDRLDSILGSYLRTQVILAFVAAVLASAGALVLGVPYAIVIFFSSFLLSLIPVIGPVVLPIPPLIVALIFTSVPTAVIYLIWLLVAEQIVTNIIGPRVQGQSVGIHPLEAMAAALLGLPIAGFLGAFLAVPIVAFLHVVVQEILHARKSSSLPGPPSPDQPEPAPATSAGDVLVSGKHP